MLGSWKVKRWRKTATSKWSKSGQNHWIARYFWLRKLWKKLFRTIVYQFCKWKLTAIFCQTRFQNGTGRIRARRKMFILNEILFSEPNKRLFEGHSGKNDELISYVALNLESIRWVSPWNNNEKLLKLELLKIWKWSKLPKNKIIVSKYNRVWYYGIFDF